MQDIAPAERKTTIMRSLAQESEDNFVLAFLWDIRQFPGSGIAQRYRRLGISVRHGQKLKTMVLNRGLIEEQIQTTKIGRIKVIKLTEKGESFLSRDN